MNNESDILSQIPDRLLKWYDDHARILPWRENPTPYRVWISEIMLQQTRVETVKPYFERFLAELPTVATLATAPEAQLLKLWEGLGYYNRVRNLQKAAQAIIERFHGEFPTDYAELLSLPGIGEYTAGAISSIAFGKPVPAVDGNVLRVISRLTESHADIANPKVKAAMTEALRAVYPATRCGDFTQSLMELGATVCLPNGAPLCLLCPLAALCVAGRHGTTAEIPVKAPKKPRKIEPKTILLLICGDQIAIRQRPSSGLLAGLWEFPALDGHVSPDAVHDHLTRHGLQIQTLEPSVTAKHIFTHLEWHMNSYLIHCTNPIPEYHWTTRETLRREITLPTALKAFQTVLESNI